MTEMGQTPSAELVMPARIPAPGSCHWVTTGEVALFAHDTPAAASTGAATERARTGDAPPLRQVERPPTAGDHRAAVPVPSSPLGRSTMAVAQRHGQDAATAEGAQGCTGQRR